MPSRRHALQAGSVAATLTLAGCAGRMTDAGATSKRLSFGETYDPDGDAVTVTTASVQSSVRHLQNTDHNDIAAGDRWYLFVSCEAEAAGPAPGDFTFRTAQGTYDPVATRNERFRELVEYVNGDAYRGMDGGPAGWLLFELPYTEPVDDARVVLDSKAAWMLPEAARERLRAKPPAFEVHNIETPERPPADEPFDVDVAVTNDGGVGTFRAAFNYTAPLYFPQGFAREFNADETRTLSVTVDIHMEMGTARAGEEVSARLVSPGGGGGFSVTLG